MAVNLKRVHAKIMAALQLKLVSNIFWFAKLFCMEANQNKRAEKGQKQALHM